MVGLPRILRWKVRPASQHPRRTPTIDVWCVVYLIAAPR